MVVVALTPYRGNHQRFFPHAGFLGLTPVLLQGTFSTTLEEDMKPLLATHAIVRARCYEADGTNSSGTKGRALNVLYENSLTVWKKRDGEQYTPLGNERHEWRLSIPRDCSAPGTASYRQYRVWWQIETVVYHKETSIMGSRKLVVHQVPLRRFAPPASQPVLPVPSWFAPLSASTRGPGYTASLTSSVFGPGDDLGLEITFESIDSAVAVKKILVSIERRMLLKGKATRRTPATHDHVASLFASGSSSTLPRRHSPPAPSTSRGSSPHPVDEYGFSSHVIATTECDLSSFSNTHHVLAPLPKMKSLFRYATGETMSTELAQIGFFVCIRLGLKTRGIATEWIDLEPRPVTMTGVSAEERSKAASAAHKLLAVAEAENRLFERRKKGKSAQTSQPPPVSIGARRSSHFAMKISLPQDVDAAMASLPSPTRSVGSAASGRDFLAEPLPDTYRPSSARSSRQRRKQEDGFSFEASPSHSRSASGDVTPMAREHQPAPSPDGSSASRTQARRAGRSNTPYSTLKRPKSVGQLSARSVRSDDAASISGRSLASSASSVRSVNRTSRHERDRSSAALSTETLLSPLSLSTSNIEISPLESQFAGYQMNPLPTPLSPPLGFPLSPPPVAGARVPSTPVSRTMNNTMLANEMTPPLIDFSGFSLKPTGQVASAMALQYDIDMAVVAPWTVSEVSPFETPPVSAKNGPSATSAWPSSRRPAHDSPASLASIAQASKSSLPPRRPPMDRTVSTDRMDIERSTPPPEPHASLRRSPPTSSVGLGGAQSDALTPPPQQKRKGSGFGLFGKVADEKPEGSRWAFIRRGSKTTTTPVQA